MFLELSNLQKMVLLKVKSCLLSLNCNILPCLKTLLEVNWIMLYWSSDPISPSCQPPSKPTNELLQVRGRKRLANISRFFQKPSGIDRETSQGCVSSPRLFPPSCEDSLRWKHTFYTSLFHCLLSLEHSIDFEITDNKQNGFNWSYNENSINDFH